MNNWREYDLSTLIASVESGGRPTGGASQLTGEIPSLGGENIKRDGGLELSGVKYVPINFYRLMRQGKLQHNDVLINKDGANTGKVGIYKGEFPDASINEHVFLLRGDNRLSQDFLYYILLSQHGQNLIRSKISGSAQPGLKRNFIFDFPVKLPIFYKEQAKIAEILSTVDHAIEDTRRFIAKYGRVKTGLMQDLLTRGVDANSQLRDPGTHAFKPSPLGDIPAEWDVAQLGAVSTLHNSLRKPIAATVREQMAGHYPYYGATGIIDWLNEYRVEGKFVLIGEDGDHYLKYLRQEIALLVEGKFSVSNHAHIVQGSSVCSTEWIQKFFAHRDITFHLTRQGAGRFKLNKATLLGLPIAVPSPEEQRQIVAILDAADATIQAQERELAKLLRLKTGIMHDLLTGTVSVAPLLSNALPMHSETDGVS